MLNLFALRATNPKAMLAHPEPIGPENDAYLRGWMCGNAPIKVVCCWGNHGAHLGRAEHVKGLIRHPTSFGLTKLGQPCHPLYLRANLQTKEWT